MVKKHWKQITAFALAFALIFQNSATLLRVAATETTTNQEGTDTTKSGTDSEENTTETGSTDTDSTESSENKTDSTDSDKEESTTDSNTNTEENTDSTTGATPTTESTTTESTTTEAAATQSTAQPATTENSTESETTSTEADTQESTQATGDTTVVIDNVTYEISDGFSQDDLPANFSTTTLDYNGNTVSAAKFNNGELYLLYLVKDGEYNGAFYVYDQTSKTAYEFQTIGDEENYIIVLKTPEGETVPNGFAETTLLLEEKSVTAYRYSGTVASTDTTSDQSSNEQSDTDTTAETTTSDNENSNAATTSTTSDSNSTDASTSEENSTEGTSTEETTSTTTSSLSPADFYLIYGMSSTGYQGWFQYDAGIDGFLRYIAFDSGEEETATDASSDELKNAQEQLNNITEKYEKEVKYRTLIVSGLIILMFIFIIIITGLIFKVRDLKHKDDWYDDDDDDNDNDKGSRNSWNDDYDYDVNGEEDYRNDDDDLVDTDIPESNSNKLNIKEGLENEKNTNINANINTNNKTAQPAMSSGFGEKNSIHSKDFSPSMEIGNEEAMMGESELAREVAKAMNGEFQKQQQPQKITRETSDDNFNFEFVDLD